MFKRFHGGIFTGGRDSATRHKHIEALDPPRDLILPMSMHAGVICDPVVKVGERVALGQIIGASESPGAAPIHASVSGRVSAIQPMPHLSGVPVLSVIIENDFQESVADNVAPYGSVESLTSEQLFTIIFGAGIVGLGGDGIPTSAKLAQSIGKVDNLFINGCESEPYFSADHRLMLEYTEEVIGGTRALMKILGVQNAVIVLESNKRDAAARLSDTLPARSPIRVELIRSRYPSGSEKILIRAMTGYELPAGAAPVVARCAVFNVSTVVAIHKAVTTGMPLISRVITVAGSAVSNPKNLNVRLGTPISEVFKSAGGFIDRPRKILAGGALAGVAQDNLDAPVIKSFAGLLAFTEADCSVPRHPGCIRCSRCVSACPMKLTPANIYLYQQKGRLSECKRLNVADCIECGSCSYVCPGRLHLVQSMRAAKRSLSK